MFSCLFSESIYVGLILFLGSVFDIRLFSVLLCSLGKLYFLRNLPFCLNFLFYWHEIFLALLCYPFNVCRICSNVLALVPGIGHLYLLFKSVLLSVHQFHCLLERPSLWCHCFLFDISQFQVYSMSFLLLTLGFLYSFSINKRLISLTPTLFEKVAWKKAPWTK